MGEKTSITYLFGAGAEKDFGLITGAQYTVETMLMKHDNLYKELKTFYKETDVQEHKEKNRQGNEEKSKLEYRSQFHLYKKSISLKTMALRAVYSCEKINDQNCQRCIFYSSTIENIKSCEYIKSKIKEKFNDQTTIEDIIADLKISPNNEGSNLMEKLMNILSESSLDFKEVKMENPFLEKIEYGGVMENDFSVLATTGNSGVKFWRLINYFWSAYFSILIPLYSTLVSKETEYNFYLNDLPGKLQDINEKINEMCNDGLYDKNYKKIRKIIEAKDYDHHIITTNYTTLAKLTGITESNIAYVAGTLSTFERFPSNRVEDIILKPEVFKVTNEIMFPFLLTQAPIKPIVSTVQVEEVIKAINFLKKSKVVIVYGNSLSKEDKHIITFMREFIEKEGSILYYLNFCEDLKKDIRVPRNAIEEKALRNKLFYKGSNEIIVYDINDRTLASVLETIYKDLM